MGHLIEGMRGVYGHETPTMQNRSVLVLQLIFEDSLQQRAAISPRSPVRTLDRLLNLALAA